MPSHQDGHHEHHHDHHHGHDHAGHSPEAFRRKFWLSLALTMFTVPVLFAWLEERRLTRDDVTM